MRSSLMKALIVAVAVACTAPATSTASTRTNTCPPSGDRPAACFYSPAALRAMGARGQAAARAYRELSVTYVTPHRAFAWDDAAIGFSAAVGLALVGLTVLAARRRWQFRGAA